MNVIIGIELETLTHSIKGQSEKHKEQGGSH